MESMHGKLNTENEVGDKMPTLDIKPNKDTKQKSKQNQILTKNDHETSKKFEEK